MKNEKVIVEKIYDAREGKNQDFKTLQLRSETPKKVTSSIVSNLLGGNFKEKRVAFQSIEKKRVGELGLTEGCDLSEKMGIDLRLTIREIPQSVYDTLPESGDANGFNKPSFKAKETPDGDPLYVNGEVIYRCTKLTSVDAEDVYLAHDPVGTPLTQEIPANTEFSRENK
jgi:hypothetical protein